MSDANQVVALGFLFLIMFFEGNTYLYRKEKKVGI